MVGKLLVKSLISKFQKKLKHDKTFVRITKKNWFPQTELNAWLDEIAINVTKRNSRRKIDRSAILGFSRGLCQRQVYFVLWVKTKWETFLLVLPAADTAHLSQIETQL